MNPRIKRYLHGAMLLCVGFAAGWTRYMGWIAPMLSTYAAVMMFLWYRKDRRKSEIQLEEFRQKVGAQEA